MLNIRLSPDVNKRLGEMAKLQSVTKALVRKAIIERIGNPRDSTLAKLALGEDDSTCFTIAEIVDEAKRRRVPGKCPR